MPWGNPKTGAAYAQNEPGFAAAVLALVIVLILASRSAADSGLRTVQFMPLLLGALCLLFGVVCYMSAASDLPSDSGNLGVLLALAGAALSATGGVATTLVLMHNRLHTDVVGVSGKGWMALDLVVGAVGAGLGLALGLRINSQSTDAQLITTFLGAAVAVAALHRIRQTRWRAE
jgi:uncharacterized membrane protein YeaQ/YmgE (transglycosylase-associated protein family)